MRRKLSVLAVIALTVVAVGATGVEGVSAATSAEMSAVNWAGAQVGHTEYEGVPWVDLCLPFVQDAYADGTGPHVPIQSIAHATGGWNANTDPQDVWSGTLSAGTTGGSSTTPPYGALVFFDAKSGYNPEDFSHVEIMGSNGEMIGTPGTPGQAVFEETLAQHEAAHDYNTYVGWWLPDGVAGSQAVGTQLAELKGFDTVAGDAFGTSVAISGTTAVVGAIFHANEAGRAYVFTKTADGWKETAELKGSDAVANDNFGYSVAISGTIIVVGAFGHANGAGRAYVFTYTAGIWKEAAELKGSDTVAHDFFGNSVAISGGTAIVGAPQHGASAGRAYVFTKTADGWKETAELRGSDTVHTNCFGNSVAISGTTAVVGAPFSNSLAGRAYVFTKTAGLWKQVAELKGSDTVAYDEFGWSVAVSGTTAVVGAPLHGGLGGSAYVFTKTAGNWKQVADLKDFDIETGDVFGEAVAISGTTVVVGAERHANYAGTAYVFTKTAGAWSQATELDHADTVVGERFGYSVAVSGPTAVVGATGDANKAGRVYVFEV